MAGRVPHEFIDDLLARTDIVSLIEEFVALKKKGNEYMACCPFHHEKTPSFSVSPNKQMYYCFGCGVGGNAIKFLMEHQHLDFLEAIEALAQKQGIDVPKVGGGGQKSGAGRHLLNALEKAAEFYTRQMQATPAAGVYLRKRGIDDAVRDRFRIGYAPPGYDYMRKVPDFGGNEKWFLESGLLTEKNIRVYARFRDRLMFPIRDRRGHVIAFGGRTLANTDQAKYLNSPETPVFHKRKTLYGAYELRHAKKLDEIIVVEGYMDVVSLAAHGVDNSVATLGTAVTEDHIRQLFKLCPRLIFCFDGDTAGRKAAVSALEQSLSVFRDGYEINFAFLPDKEDPDSLIKSKGKPGFETFIEQAMPLSEFLFVRLGEGLDLSLPEGGATFTKRARHLLAVVPGGAFRDLTIKNLAARAKVKADYLIPQDQVPSATTTNARRSTNPRETTRHYSTIRMAALLLTKDPSLANTENTLPHADIQKIQLRGAAFLADMVNKIKNHTITNTASLLEVYRDTRHENVIERLANWSPPQTQNEKEEYRQTMETLRMKLNDQEKETLIAVSRTRALTEEEKERFRELQRKAEH